MKKNNCWDLRIIVWVNYERENHKQVWESCEWVGLLDRVEWKHRDCEGESVYRESGSGVTSDSLKAQDPFIVRIRFTRKVVSKLDFLYRFKVCCFYSNESVWINDFIRGSLTENFIINSSIHIQSFEVFFSIKCFLK